MNIIVVKAFPLTSEGHRQVGLLGSAIARQFVGEVRSRMMIAYAPTAMTTDVSFSLANKLSIDTAPASCLLKSGKEKIGEMIEKYARLGKINILIVIASRDDVIKQAIRFGKKRAGNKSRENIAMSLGAFALVNDFGGVQYMGF